MKTVLLVCAIVVAACLSFFGYRGKQALERRKSFFEHISEIDETELEYLDYISYHGGLPEIPKPQKLNIAVAKDYLLLFSNPTRFCKVAFGRWRDIETFSTKLKKDPRKQSLVLWGPLEPSSAKGHRQAFPCHTLHRRGGSGESPASRVSEPGEAERGV